MDTSGEGCCAALLSALSLIQSCYITRRQHSLPRSSQRGRSSWNLGFIGFTAPPVNRTGMDRTANLGGKGRRWTCPAEIVYYVRVTHASIRHSISFACVTKAHGPGVVEFLPQTYCQQASRSSFRPTHRAEGGGRRAVTGAGGRCTDRNWTSVAAVFMQKPVFGRRDIDSGNDDGRIIDDRAADSSLNPQASRHRPNSAFLNKNYRQQQSLWIGKKRIKNAH